MQRKIDFEHFALISQIEPSRGRRQEECLSRLAHSVFDILNGGNVWESNPPCPLVAGNTGFEVQEGHQSPIHSL